MIAGLRRDRPAFLASVINAAEAEIVLQGGADIIDCKDPSRGALGALDGSVVHDIVARVGGRAPVSATIGDLPNDVGTICAAATAMAATGVDIVKIGFFGEGDARPAIRALNELGLTAKLFAVLMADRQADFSLVDSLAHHGFAGVMLDTADKVAGRLPGLLPRAVLVNFIGRAEAAGLTTGLAGSLRIDDIETLAALAPHVLGFRGALCVKGRSTAIDARKVRNVRAALDGWRHGDQEQSVA